MSFNISKIKRVSKQCKIDSLNSSDQFIGRKISDISLSQKIRRFFFKRFFNPNIVKTIAAAKKTTTPENIKSSWNNIVIINTAEDKIISTKKRLDKKIILLLIKTKRKKIKLLKTMLHLLKSQKKYFSNASKEKLLASFFDYRQYVNFVSLQIDAHNTVLNLQILCNHEVSSNDVDANKNYSHYQNKLKSNSEKIGDIRNIEDMEDIEIFFNNCLRQNSKAMYDINLNIATISSNENEIVRKISMVQSEIISLKNQMLPLNGKESIC